jgi:hypothetical protein
LQSFFLQFLDTPLHTLESPSAKISLWDLNLDVGTMREPALIHQEMELGMASAANSPALVMLAATIIWEWPAGLWEAREVARRLHLPNRPRNQSQYSDLPR